MTALMTVPPTVPIARKASTRPAQGIKIVLIVAHALPGAIGPSPVRARAPVRARPVQRRILSTAMNSQNRLHSRRISSCILIATATRPSTSVRLQMPGCCGTKGGDGMLARLISRSIVSGALSKPPLAAPRVHPAGSTTMLVRGGVAAVSP
eukprot:3446678-Prymnesium_polylepis.1